MAWAIRQYEPKQVDDAGRKLASLQYPAADDVTLNILNNWRSAHSYPLNTFQITLRNKAKKLEQDIVVAQRIKRLESIHAKLFRQKSMRMTQMQDIAGCRVVFRSMASVRALVERYKLSKFDHKLKSEKDYISNPKRDGYRCYHLVFEYVGTEKTRIYDGLKVEIQVRTQLQHAWATAVEAVGTFTRQALKSNQGGQDWLRFFSLMGAIVAAIEQCAPVPGTPTDKEELLAELVSLATKLHVQDVLTVYNATLNLLGSARDAKYFLLSLDPDTKRITAQRFKASESEFANSLYTKLESQIPEGSAMQVVLVSVDSVAALKRAYPNYFLDTVLFNEIVKKSLRGGFPHPIAEKSTYSI